TGHAPELSAGHGVEAGDRPVAAREPELPVAQERVVDLVAPAELHLADGPVPSRIDGEHAGPADDPHPGPDDNVAADERTAAGRAHRDPRDDAVRPRADAH